MHAIAVLGKIRLHAIVNLHTMKQELNIVYNVQFNAMDVQLPPQIVLHVLM